MKTRLFEISLGAPRGTSASKIQDYAAAFMLCGLLSSATTVIVTILCIGLPECLVHYPDQSSQIVFFFLGGLAIPALLIWIAVTIWDTSTRAAKPNS